MSRIVWNSLLEWVERPEFWRELSRSNVKRFSLAVATPIIVALVQLAIWDHISPLYFVFFFPAVILSSAIGGLWPGLLSVGISCCLADYLFIPPEWKFALGAKEMVQVLGFAISASIGALCCSYLAHRFRELLLSRLDESLREANERLRWKNVELRRSNEDLARFAHVASHDMKEPLRMIANYVTLLERDYGSHFDDRGRIYMRFAVDGAFRINTLVNDILAYSTVSSGELQTDVFDLSTCAREALSNLKKSISESKAEVHLGELPTVRCNQAQIVRVLQNLVGNAVKFKRPEAKPVVSIGSADRVDHWEIWVQDNGIGVAASDREKIFGLFKRVHSRDEYPGTGIGLATCKRIVERHGGKIRVESVAEGSRFIFTLPKLPPRQPD